MIYQILNINDISASEYARFYALMSKEKQARVNRYHFEADKKRSIAGELLARRLLSEYCNITPEQIVFGVKEKGKPFAEGVNAYFNISHSGNWALCAVDTAPVGVDIEVIQEADRLLIQRVCNMEERAYIFNNSISSVAKNRRFLEVWTFKEACFKCVGSGLGDFSRFRFFDTSIKKKVLSEKEYIATIVSIEKEVEI